MYMHALYTAPTKSIAKRGALADSALSQSLQATVYTLSSSRGELESQENTKVNALENQLETHRQKCTAYTIMTLNHSIAIIIAS